jgi:ribonuclease HI
MRIITPRQVARIAGQLVAISLAFTPARLYLQAFYKFVKTHIQGRMCWDQSFQVSEELSKDIEWISHHLISNTGKTAWTLSSINVVQTDASKSGWGATLNDNQRAGGSWSIKQRQLHINVLELKAILLALKTFRNFIKGSKIKIIGDNSVNINILVKWSSKSEALTLILRKIFGWCMETSTEIVQCQLIQSMLNIVPDRLSRTIDSGDWIVKEKIFKELCKRWGIPEIDRFADHRNRKVKRFNSWMWCPETQGVDAFTKEWHNEFNWIVVPFNLLRYGWSRVGGRGYKGS